MWDLIVSVPDHCLSFTLKTGVQLVDVCCSSFSELVTRCVLILFHLSDES